MAKKYISLGQLSIASELLEFVNKELLPGTGINKKKFWVGLSKCAHDLSLKNKNLLGFREILQKKIDIWHRNRRGKKINNKKYLNFLKSIGYLKKEGKKFKILTKNIDNEISTIAGPQLVVPVMNARYSLNAANSRWGSLYDALYGTDVISEINGAERGKKYNYIRGEKVIKYARNFLDSYAPLKNGSWKNITKIPKVENNKLTLKLKNPKQFVGYKKKSGHLFSLLLKNNNLHIDIKFDPNYTIGGLKDNAAGGLQDKAAIYDIILESAITTIMDHEDSVAAVDAQDKVKGYRNWLGLMKGDLQYIGEKNGKKLIRKLNSDREYISPNGKKFNLHGRALMLNRNVGPLQQFMILKIKKTHAQTLFMLLNLKCMDQMKLLLLI